MHGAELAPGWGEEMRRDLWEGAPWKLAKALDDGDKASRRLTTFGGQHHLRKASLTLARIRGGVELRIEYTGTNARLPREAYGRALEHDLARFEIASPHLPPESATPLVVDTPKQVNVEKESATMAEKLRHLEGAGYDAALKAGKKLEPRVAARVLEEAMAGENPRGRRRACHVAAALTNAWRGGRSTPRSGILPHRKDGGGRGSCLATARCSRGPARARYVAEVPSNLSAAVAVKAFETVLRNAKSALQRIRRSTGSRPLGGLSSWGARVRRLRTIAK